MSDRQRVQLFTDVLCVYAYGADIRFRTMVEDFGDQIEVEPHFITIYGDVRRRIQRSGKTNEAYGAGVRSTAARFPHVTVHPEIFCRNVPTSSLSPHLFLTAVKVLAARGETPHAHAFRDLTWSFREAFFKDLIDVSQRREQLALAERAGLPIDAILGVIDSGEAFAELAHDMTVQRELSVSVSPALVLNEGRQSLNGNVGYRVIEANLRELMRGPTGEASWC